MAVDFGTDDEDCLMVLDGTDETFRELELAWLNLAAEAGVILIWTLFDPWVLDDFGGHPQSGFGGGQHGLGGGQHGLGGGQHGTGLGGGQHGFTLTGACADLITGPERQLTNGRLMT